MPHTPTKLSWYALAMAPLPVTLTISIVLEMVSPGRSPVLAVLFMFCLGSILACGAMAFLFAPCLLLVSTITRLTVGVSGLVGAVVAGSAWFPAVWFAYRSSGRNSGPPAGVFADYFWRELTGPTLWIFLAVGLVIGLIYWRTSQESVE